VISFPPLAFAEEDETNSVCPEGEEEDEQDVPECCPRLWMEYHETGRVCVKMPTAMNVAVALTLILLFTFMISLQCFLNHHNIDMREMAYEGISSTVSIFTAVLSYQTLDGLLEDFIHRPLVEATGWAPKDVDMVVNVAHMLFWYTCTQVTIAHVSNAWAPRTMRSKSLSETRDEHGRTKKMLDVEIRSVCYGMLLAHLTGFASIRFWTQIQQMQPFNESPLKSLAVIPLTLVANLCLEFLTFNCRRVFSRGSRDWFEETWKSKCVQAEDDIMGLAMSVMIVNSLRYYVNSSFGHNCLPGFEQKESGPACNYPPRFLPALCLFGLGVVFMMFLFLTKLFFIKISAEEEHEVAFEARRTSKLIRGETLYDEEKPCLKEFIARLEDVTLTTWGMAHAWCIFHSTRALLKAMNPDMLGEGDNRIILAVVLAFGVTYLSWIMSRIMHLIADRAYKWSLPDVDASIRSAIQATSTFVGFSWEQTFDQSIDSLAEVMREDFGPRAPAIAKLLLGSLCVGVVFFAWKWYILPFVFKKGWRFGYIFSKTDLHERCHELAEHDKTFTLQHLKEIGSNLARKNTDHRNRFHRLSTQLNDGIEDGYKRLPSCEFDQMLTELEALKAYTRDLEENLAAETEARAKDRVQVEAVEAARAHTTPRTSYEFQILDAGLGG